MRYFTINKLETNERRNQLILKDKSVEDYYFIIDFIKNEVYMNDGSPTQHKDFYKINNTIYAMEYFHDFDLEEVELWQKCYIQNLAKMINGIRKTRGFYAEREYSAFKRAFIDHKHGNVFKTFSPIIEQISKMGLVLSSESFKQKIDLNLLKRYAEKDYTKNCTLVNSNTLQYNKVSRIEEVYVNNAFATTLFNSICSIVGFNFKNIRMWVADNYKQLDFLLNTCNYNLLRLLHYLIVDVDWQGLAPIDFSNDDDTFKLFYDYVKMSYDITENTKFDKYPKYLATYHDIVAKNYKMKEDEIVIQKFKKIIENCKFDNYTNKDYIMVVPKEPSDLTKEGSLLHHCVGSYVKRVAEGENFIIFCRKASSINSPLLTIDVNLQRNKISQVEGFGRRSPNPQEIKFIKQFANHFGLEYGKEAYEY